MDMSSLWKNFKISDVVNYGKMYLLFFRHPRKFWEVVMTKTWDEITREVFFFILVTVTFVLVIVFVDEKYYLVALKNVLIDLFINVAITSVILFLTSFLLKRYRINSIKYVRLSFLFVLYTRLMTYPFALMFLNIFLKYEEANFLFLGNFFALLVFFYYFFYSSFLFYRKFVIKILASLINIILLNAVQFLILEILFSSTISKKKLALNELDPIRYEYFNVHKGVTSVNTIPFKSFNYMIKGQQHGYRNFEYLEIRISMTTDEDKVDADLKSFNPPFLWKRDHKYRDSLSNAIRQIDSLDKKLEFEMNKNAFNAEKKLYSDLKYFVENSFDTVAQKVRWDKTALLKNLKDTDYAVVLYDVFYECAGYVNTYYVTVNSYNMDFKKAYMPEKIYDLFFFYHFFIKTRFGDDLN